jgi:hypothetical protein
MDASAPVYPEILTLSLSKGEDFASAGPEAIPLRSGGLAEQPLQTFRLAENIAGSLRKSPDPSSLTQ